MKHLTYLAIVLSLSISNADAQLLEEPAPSSEPQISEPQTMPQPTDNTQQEITIEQIAKQIEEETAKQPPNNITAEEKAQIKKPLMEDIIENVDKMDERERRELLRAMKFMQTTSVRRQNLNLPEDEQLSIDDDTQVNPKSTKEVRNYMLDKVVKPIDRSMNIE